MEEGPWLWEGHILYAWSASFRSSRSVATQRGRYFMLEGIRFKLAVRGRQESREDSIIVNTYCCAVGTTSFSMYCPQADLTPVSSPTERLHVQIHTAQRSEWVIPV